MGTKLEYTITNPLPANSFIVNEWGRFDDRGLLKRSKHQKSGQDRFQDIMDKKMLDLDSIKRTMQLHEDVFKHQVRELHRLYSVQKMLMSELKKEMEKKKHMDTETEANHLMMMRMEDPMSMSSRERSSCSCTGDNMRMARGFDLDRPAPEEDMSTGISRNKGVDVDEVELTLSIGVGGSSSARELHSSASFKAADRGGGDCSEPTTPISSSSASLDKERNRPHWLFQGLSLNSKS